jgi:two-component system cell cycle sensor histidine kinase/response regulator CckA
MRAAGLTRQLLTFSRKQKREPEALALNSIVTRIEAMLTRIVGEDIEMSAMLAPHLGTIESDPGEVEQVLMNLVVNARDAMPAGGRVLLETSNVVVDDTHAAEIGVSVGRYVVLAVTDTGCGMREEVRTRIFEPFFTTKDIGKGTGLGLSTVFGIVKQTKGFITVDSDVGRGTTFSIYLPRYHGEAPTAERVVLRDVTGEDTILLVDDEDGVRRIAARGLENRGYKVLQAPSGEEGLEMLQAATTPIHMLITDVKMPGMDGPTLAREVRKLRPDMRILFISGFIGDVFRENEERPEDVHFLTKPFGLSQLTAKVKDVLSGAPPGKSH